MMSSRVTLIYTDERGTRRRVVVRKSPFTIGSAPGNDISISDPAIAERHARIDFIGGRHCLSDCRSGRGTSLNGQRVSSPVELRSGDTIGLGQSKNLSVRIVEDEEDEASERRTHGGGRTARAEPTAGEALAALSRNPAVAGTAVGLLVLATFGLILVLFRPAGPSSNNSSGGNVVVKRSATPTLTPSTGTPDVAPNVNVVTNLNVNENDDPSHGDDGDTGREIETEVRRVMSRIGNDSGAYISDEGLKDVQQQVRNYRGSSSLAERLRAMSNEQSKVAELARSINIKPSLLAYAALAQSEKNGKPVETAQQMTQKLDMLCNTFTPESSNRFLIVVAAYPYPFEPHIGTQTRVTHPLAQKLQSLGGRSSKILPAEAGTVWFLRREKAITPEAYDLVIRTLAIGVIAQYPKRYGVEADPLPF